MRAPTTPPCGEAAAVIEESEYASRRSALLDALDTAGAQAVVLGPSANLRYFTDVKWKLSERLLGCVFTKNRPPVFVCPAFEAPRLVAALPPNSDFEVTTWEEDESPERVCIDVIGQGESQAAVLIDPALPTRFAFALQREAGETPLRSAERIIDALRGRKSPSEIALIQAAMHITLSVHRTIHDALEPGLESHDVKREIDRLHRERGADDGSTFCIVSFGEDTAIPHGNPASRKLESGQLVLIDAGCTLHGYHSDLTRTYVFGEPTARQRDLWRLELEAQLAGFAAASDGGLCESIDAAARSVLGAAGYGPGYQLPGLPHRTGHGIGLELHEAPYFVRGDKTPLEVGVCGSIEPMLCLPGEAGIRLEDHFVVSAEGVRWFTDPSPSLDAPFG